MRSMRRRSATALSWDFFERPLREVRLPAHIEMSKRDGTILPATSGHQIHPPPQVVEARVVAEDRPCQGVESGELTMPTE